MNSQEAPHTVAVVSACMTVEGFPTFVLNEVRCTIEEQLEGIPYLLVEKRLLADGYEETFVHFAEGEGPAFLHPAVRGLAGLDVPAPTLVLVQEDR